LHFAPPSGFNDPFDSRPTLTCDSSIEELRVLLERLIQKRVAAEVDASCRRLSIKRKEAALYAAKYGENRVREALARISYHASYPDYEEGQTKAEEWLLTHEIEYELLLHYERGVCCFSADYDNPLLWSHYGDQHRGLCIGYTRNRKPVPRLHRVKYCGDRSIPTSLLIEVFCHNRTKGKYLLDGSVLLRKAKDWSYEREWRLIGEAGLQDSPLLLTEIIFGMRCSESVRYAVVQSLSTRGDSVSFYEMVELRNHYSLQRRSLDIDRLSEHMPHVAISVQEMFPPDEDQETR
jgi:hypothetical protein